MRALERAGDVEGGEWDAQVRRHEFANEEPAIQDPTLISPKTHHKILRSLNPVSLKLLLASWQPDSSTHVFLAAQHPPMDLIDKQSPASTPTLLDRRLRVFFEAKHPGRFNTHAHDLERQHTRYQRVTGPLSPQTTSELTRIRMVDRMTFFIISFAYPYSLPRYLDIALILRQREKRLQSTLELICAAGSGT
jgi:hypothetical protein